MNRRQFLKTAGSVPTLTLASALSAQDNSYLPHTSKMLRGSEKSSEEKLELLAGSLPEDIYGHVFATEGMSDDSDIFAKSGRGAVNRLDLSGTGIFWKRSLIQTPSVLMADALRGSSYEFRPLAKLLYVSKALGYMNTANTSIMSVHDGLMILTFEGGVHWLFDPYEMKLISPMGSSADWRPGVTGIMGVFDGKKLFPQYRTTAHPYYDHETGEVLTLNYASKLNIAGIKLGRPFTHLLRFWGSGAFERVEVLNIASGKPVVIENTSHSFLTTRNHIGIVDTPAVVEGELFLGIPRVKPQPARLVIWWVRRKDIRDGGVVYARRVEIPREYIDVVVNFDDYGDEITLYSGSVQSYDQSEFLRKGDRLFYNDRKCRRDLLGLAAAPNDFGGFMQCRIKISEREAQVIEEDFLYLSDPKLNWGIDFPAYMGNFKVPEKFEYMFWNTSGLHPDRLLSNLVEIYRDQPYRNLSINNLPEKPVAPAILGLNCSSVTIEDSYSLPQGVAMSSLQFVPKKGNSADMKKGYLIFFTHYENPDTQRSSGQEVWIMDGENLAQGPIAKLGHRDINIATTLHSTWVPALSQSRSNYKVDLLSNHKKMLDQQDDAVKKAFYQEVLPYF